MYFGQYNHSLDDKCRMRIPAKLRSTLGNFVITKGSNHCLFVFGRDYFEKEFLTNINQIPTFNQSAQKPIRALLSSVFEVEEDSQSRFVLPTYLKEYAQIDKSIVLIGVGNRIEIWAKQVWEDYMNDQQDFDSILSSLGEYNV